MDIQSVNFLFPRNAKPDRLVDDGEYYDGHHQHVGSGCADSDQLSDKAAAFSEYTGQDRTCGAADTVNTDRTDRIVDLDNLVAEFNGEYH